MRVALTVAFALFVAACEPVWPGEAVGAYHVTATPTSNGCGAVAIDARTVTFDVELRRQDSFAYWRRSGAALVGGGYDVNGAFTFQTSDAIANVGSDGGVPCTLMQSESIVGTSAMTLTADGGVLDAGTSDDGGVPTVLMGTDDVTFDALRGTDCSPLLASRGGAFYALPCTVHYELVGVPRGPIP
jgi:hypothetical protein